MDVLLQQYVAADQDRIDPVQSSNLRSCECQKMHVSNSGTAGKHVNTSQWEWAIKKKYRVHLLWIDPDLGRSSCQNLRKKAYLTDRTIRIYAKRHMHLHDKGCCSSNTDFQTIVEIWGVVFLGFWDLWSWRKTTCFLFRIANAHFFLRARFWS